MEYVRNAYPCKGSEKEEWKEPYFYDPSELEDETTDGKLTSEDGDGDGDANDSQADGDDGAETAAAWTLPPGENYLGYVPGKGEVQKIPSSVYENYKSQEELEKEEEEKKKEALDRKKTTDLKSQLRERKKIQKKIIKGFALLFAGLVLLIPVVCLIMQVLGLNDDKHDGFANGGGGGAIYDQEEMKLLKRHRRRGGKPSTSERGRHGKSLYGRPVREIEII